MACSLQDALLETGFSACEIPIDLSKPRSIIATGTSSLLALERGTESVVFLFDADGDGMPDSKRTVISANSLNHGLAVHEGFIYASSDTTVYRWHYTRDFLLDSDAEIVVENMNADGQGGAPEGHRTRTLIFDEQNRLYISVGSNGNVDADSHRSRIRRFDLENATNLPLNFQLGDIFADGLRNEVGLTFDVHGDLWGVENGADNLYRSDLGGDIHQDNPAEELNRFKEEDIGKHWGYPYCWTEFSLPAPPGMGKGTVWAWPSFLSSGAIADNQCRQGYVAPVVSMQGHSAPLGITFYSWKEQEDSPTECENSLPFPKEMDGYAFIAFHGSWNRDIPTGYKVVYVPMDANGNPTGGVTDLLAHKPPGANWDNGFRPVDVDFDECGRLLVSSDGTRGAGSSIVRMEYSGKEEKESLSPTMLPSTLTTTQMPVSLTLSPYILPSRQPSMNPTLLSLNDSTSLQSSIPTNKYIFNPSNDPPANPTNPVLTVPGATDASTEHPTFLCENETSLCSSSPTRWRGITNVMVLLTLLFSVVNLLA